MSVPLRREGVNTVPLRKTNFFSNGEVPTAIKLEGEGDLKTLMALPLKKKCGFPKPDRFV